MCIARHMLLSHVHSPGSPQHSSGLGKYWIKSLVLSHEDKNILYEGGWLSDAHIQAAHLLLRKPYPTRMVSRVHHGFSSCLSGTQIQMTLSKSSTSVGSTGSVHPTLILLLALWMYMTASPPTQLDYNHFICHPANTRAPVPYSLYGCLVSEWRFRLWFVCYC